MRLTECFKIRIEQKQDPFGDRGSVIKEMVCDKYKLTYNPVTILADPFLYVHDDTLYLFYEKKRLFTKGVICMTCSKDLIHWSTSKTVLEEDYHLSYPWVFVENGKIYMIPETCASKSIRLYEAASNDLSQFVFKKTLITDDDSNDISFSDSSIFVSNNVHYLMTTICQHGTNILKLYTSDNGLFGPYSKHVMSPVVIDSKLGRNAGSLFEYQDKLYRVAQDCGSSYGEDVHLLLIDTLSKENYKEHIYKESLLKKPDGFYKHGGHQFNYVRFGDDYIVATDAKEYHYYIVPKFINKIQRLIQNGRKHNEQ